jgi:single-strand DNA-binding protein
MAAYELTGAVKAIMDQQTFASGFTKREFVVTSEDRYPQDVKFECVRDNCALVDKLNVGDRVTVTFDVRGNEYNGRYFVNLQAWKVNVADAAATGAPEDDAIPLDQMEEPALDPATGLPF